MHVYEIPKIVMGALSLRDFIVRFRLPSMDQVRKFHGILKKEDGNIIAHNVPITLTSIEFDGETADITDSIGTSTATQDGREAKEDWRLTRCIGKNAGTSDIRSAFVKLEVAKSCSTSGVDDSFWYPFVVEAMNLESIANQHGHLLRSDQCAYLFSSKVIFEKRGTCLVFCCHSQPVVGIRLLDAII